MSKEMAAKDEIELGDLERPRSANSIMNRPAMNQVEPYLPKNEDFK